MSEFIISFSEAEDLRIYLQQSSPPLPPRLWALRYRLEAQLQASPAPPAAPPSAPLFSSAYFNPKETVVGYPSQDEDPERPVDQGNSEDQGVDREEQNPRQDTLETSALLDEAEELILELLEESGLNSKFDQLSSERARGLKRRAREVSPDGDHSTNENANANAPKECPRSGRPGKRRRRKALQGPGEVEADQVEESQKYVGVSEPTPPSQDILSQTSGLLSKIASSHVEDLDTWVEDISNLMNGSEWASQAEALGNNSLLCIARRCQRAETISSGANFVRIMAELFFAAKVNGILLHHALPQLSSQGDSSTEQRRWKFRVSISSSMDSLLENGISKSTSFNWYRAGSRWARLAASGSIYLLIIIASNPGLAASLQSSAITSSVILHLCNEIRQPQSSLSQYWVAQQLVPTVAKLQERIPLTIPSLYSPQVQQYYGVSAELDCWNVNLTDQYFDTFHQNIYLCLPRSYPTWQIVTAYQVKEGERSQLSNLESRFLTQSSNFEDQAPISDFTEEDKDIEAELSISKFQITAATSDSYTVLPSFFSIEAAVAAEIPSPPHKSSKSARIKLTEKCRKAALKAKEPGTVQELSERLLEHYHQDTGRLKGKGWTLVSQKLIAGRELQVNDREGKLLFYTNGTLSQELRDQLEYGLKAWSEAVRPTISGAEWLNRNSADSTSDFSAFHFSFYSKYGVKGHEAPPDVHPLHLRRSGGLKTNTSQFFPHPSGDMQQFPEAYELLSNVF